METCEPLPLRFSGVVSAPPRFVLCWVTSFLQAFTVSTVWSGSRNHVFEASSLASAVKPLSGGVRNCCSDSTITPLLHFVSQSARFA